MLVTIGLAASAGPSVVAQGSLPKFSLVAAVAVLAAAIVLLAYGLMPCGKATPVPTAKDVENANLRILKPIWTGTALLAVGVLFAAVALISAFLGDREAALGSKDRPVHVAR